MIYWRYKIFQKFEFLNILVFIVVYSKSKVLFYYSEVSGVRCDSSNIFEMTVVNSSSSFHIKLLTVVEALQKCTPTQYL